MLQSVPALNFEPAGEMAMKCLAISLVTFLLLALSHPTAWAQTRDEKVRTDRDEIADNGRWIYNDLRQGFAAAQQTGKPLLIVFR